MISRRKMMLTSAAALATGENLLGAIDAQSDTQPARNASAGIANTQGYIPVVTPNGSTLPWKYDNGVKVFHLIAEPVKREFAPGMIVDCWGYNGQTPGPTIEAVEGDRVRILVTNKLPESTSIHWHGIILPNGMDGVGGLTQPHIEPGETYAYEFTLKQHGTHMYHPHSDEMLQIALGMQGFFIIHPKQPREPKVDRDFCIMLNEWFIAPGTSRPNPMVMLDFNNFTFNSRVWPGTDPLVVKQNQRVRIRFANISMDSHPIHFHGHVGYLTGTDGGPIQPSAWTPLVTVNVPTGSTHDVEFVADNPGDWPLHCHKTHHAMNAMSHDIPNLVGVDKKNGPRIAQQIPGYMAMGHTGMNEMSDMHMELPKNTLPMMTGEGPFGPIGMGGMFTVIKIRPDITSYEDPGWYTQPAGTAAKKVETTSD